MSFKEAEGKLLTVNLLEKYELDAPLVVKRSEENNKHVDCTTNRSWIANTNPNLSLFSKFPGQVNKELKKYSKKPIELSS